MSQPPDPNPYQSPKAPQRESAQDVIPVSAGSPWGLWATIAGSILLVMGLSWLEPGYGLLAAMVLAPAQVRAVVRLWKEAHRAGAWPKPAGQLAVFVSSVLVTIPVLIASTIAFSSVCFAGAISAATLLTPAPGDEYGFGLMFWGGVPLGTLVGLVVFGLAWRWSVRKRVFWEKELPSPAPCQELKS